MLGDPDREDVAKTLGVSRTTLASYERGETAPDANAIAAYREGYGVSVLWLVSGIGEMFEERDKAGIKPAPVNSGIFETLARLAEQAHKEAGIKLPAVKLTAEAADLYNQLQSEVTDLNDTEEIEANLPRLKLALKRRLEQAIANPGTGKHEALSLIHI